MLSSSHSEKIENREVLLSHAISQSLMNSSKEYLTTQIISVEAPDTLIKWVKSKHLNFFFSSKFQLLNWNQ